MRKTSRSSFANCWYTGKNAQRFVVLTLAFLKLSVAAAQEKRPPRVELEADPFAYLLQGYSLHAGVTYGRFRSSIGVFAIEQPSFFVRNDQFSVHNAGIDVKTDYLFGTVSGWHTGLQLTYNNSQIKLKPTQEQTTLRGLDVGLRAGYRFMLGKKENQYKGLYINPWVALLYAPGATSVRQGDYEYRQPTFYPFPTIHVGWRF